MTRALLNTCSEVYIEKTGISPLLGSYGISIDLKEEYKNY